MIWSRLVCFGIMALMFLATRPVFGEPQRVLLLHSFGRDFAPYSSLSGVVRTEIASQLPGSVDFFDVSLESARFRDTFQEGPLVDYLLAQFHEVANAPLFGFHDSQLGRGVVGGPLVEIEVLGRSVAEVARRILQGENPGDLRMPVQRPGTSQFDGRELRRWGIREGRLPVGSIVRFRQPTLWELYRWLIIGVLVVVAIETVLIASLLINRARRRKGEAVASLIADLSSRFIHLPPGEVDRAIENAQQRVCECLGLDISTLWQWAPDQPDTLRLTHMYRRFSGPVIPERLQAREHLPWTLEQLRANRVVALSVHHAPAEAARDRELWRHLGLKTVLHLPLTVGGGPSIGFLSFNDTQADRNWPDLLVQWLRLVAQIFANALARKRADKELRASEERFRSIALNLPGVVYQYYARDNGQRGTYFVGGRAKEVFGVDPEPLDTFPERFNACVAPEDRQQWLDSIENAVCAVRLWEGEARFLKPTGEKMYVRGVSEPERREGELVFSGVLQDVTERKCLDLALARSERRYRTLHESIRDAFVSVDMTGVIQDFNPVFRQMLGYSDEELRQQTYLDLPPERWHTFEAGIVRDQVLVREYSEVYEKEYRRKDGTVFPVELRAYLVRDESDRPVAMWAIVRDVTERKQAEAALREFSARLIRTQEEERARLARELHDDITQRLAHLAIEVGRATEFAPATPGTEAGSSVREELIRLSEDIHALSYRLHPSILEDLGLVAAVQAEAERLERHVPNPIEVQVHNLPEPISPEIALCVFRIAQEALRNAIRHAHARTLTVSLFGSNGGLQLGVQDDGCGFDIARERHRFSLGLASMRERAHLLGGELDIDSAPGRGTTVTVWIPLQQPARTDG